MHLQMQDNNHLAHNVLRNDLAESLQLITLVDRLWAWSSCCKLLSALDSGRRPRKKYSIEVGWVSEAHGCKKARGYVNPPGWPDREEEFKHRVNCIPTLWWRAHVDTLIDKLVHVHCVSRRWRSISDVLLIVTGEFHGLGCLCFFISCWFDLNVFGTTRLLLDGGQVAGDWKLGRR